VALSEALTAAKAVKDARGQTEVDAALATLQAAHEALVRASTEKTGCGAALSLHALTLLGTLSTAVLCTKKRK
jgi:hypothetical protein